MSSIICIDGMKIEYRNGRLTINGKEVNISHIIKEEKEKKNKIITKSTTIDDDVIGDIKVDGDNIILKINGDVTGSIIGDCQVNIGGDLTGNVSNCDIRVDGDVTGNIVGTKIQKGKSTKTESNL